MKNKIFLFFGFLILFFIFIFFFSTNNVEAFTYVDGLVSVDFGDIDSKLYDYYFITSTSDTSTVYDLYTFNTDDLYFNLDTRVSPPVYNLWTRGAYKSYHFKYDLSTREVSTSSNSKDYGTCPYSKVPTNFIYSNFDLKKNSGDIIFKASRPKPFISNFEDIENNSFDSVFVYSGSYSGHIFLYFDEYIFDNVVNEYYLYNTKVFDLDDYLVNANTGEQTGACYIIPKDDLFLLKEGYKYGFRAKYDSEEADLGTFIISPLTEEEKNQAFNDKQIALQEEQNKTSKGIWDTLKQVLDFINPLSENFFVYKLVELLIEALKSLFIPSEDFFTNFATDMNEWLSDRLGILYYPIDLVVDFLERIGNLESDNSAVISWNEFKFMGATLLQSGSYDLYSLVNGNDTLKSIHSIYLVFTDVILWLGLIFLAKNTFVDIFGGKYDVDDVIESSSSHDNKVLAKNIKAREERRYRRYRLR